MTILTQRDIFDISGKELYLRRWSLWLPFGCSVKLHQIVRADDDRCQHDHPWIMIRIILAGGYIEEICGRRVARKPWRPWAPWRVYPVRATFKHRIVKLFKDASWSLILCGPKTHAWGFYTKEGWVPWKSFIAMATSKRILWCEDGKVLNDE